MKIAVILVNYNGLNDTLACLASLEKSVLPIQPIVVDNASKYDEGSSISSKFPNTIVIKTDINKGFSGGNNIAIKYALENNFDYICLLNNDTEVSPNLFEKMLLKCDENTLIAPLIYYYNKPDIIWSAGGDILPNKGNVGHRYIDTKENITNDYECTFATGCCWFAHRNLFKEIGLLSEEYFMYCEDTDYCLRLLQKKKKILFVHDAILWHKVSSSSGGEMSPFSVYYMTRNRFYILNKFPDSFAYTALPYTLFSRIIRIFQYAITGNIVWKSMIKGICDYYKGVKGKADRVA